MNRLLYRAAIAMASTLAAYAPLFAVAPTPPNSLAGWVQKVNHKVDEVIVAPANDVSGIVHVDFRRGSDGAPTDISIRATTPELRVAAQQTIARIGALPPLPDGYDPHQFIGMQLLFSNDDGYGYAKQRSAMLADAARQNSQLALNHTSSQLASVQHEH